MKKPSSKWVSLRKTAIRCHVKLIKPAGLQPITAQQEIIESLKNDRKFTYNNSDKSDRERWTVNEWLHAKGCPATKVDDGNDPPDLFVDGYGVEIVEAMEPRRKRGDEYDCRLLAAKNGYAAYRSSSSCNQVREQGHDWVFEKVKKKAHKYGSRSSRWTLIVYVNFSWADRLRWDKLKIQLRALVPVFQKIEAVYHTKDGPVARTVYEQIRATAVL